MNDIETITITRTNDCVTADNDILNLEKQHLPAAEYNPNDKWVKDYIEQFGTTPNFFK